MFTAFWNTLFHHRISSLKFRDRPKNNVFWDMTLCRMVNKFRRFRIVLLLCALRLCLSSWIEAKMSIEMWEISNEDCYTLKMDAEESSERPITIYLLRFTCWHKVIRQRAWLFLNTSVGTSSSLLTTNLSQNQDLVGIDVFPAHSGCRYFRY